MAGNPRVSARFLHLSGDGCAGNLNASAFGASARSAWRFLHWLPATQQRPGQKRTRGIPGLGAEAVPGIGEDTCARPCRLGPETHVQPSGCSLP